MSPFVAVAAPIAVFVVTWLLARNRRGVLLCRCFQPLALTSRPCPCQAKKQERCAVDVSASFEDADAAAEGVRLRVEMQRAVDEERCEQVVPDCS